VRGSAVVAMLPVALVVGAPRAARVEWWRVAIWGVCDALAYFAFVLAADHGPTAVAGVLAAQFGTVGAIVAVLFFGERLRTRQVVGVAIVALAVGVMAVGSS
jgi:drug/metabolite transporter (DMT)-like permease